MFVCYGTLHASSAAFAREPIRGRPTLGLRVSWLEPVNVAGGIGPYPADKQDLTLAALPYADWQFTDVFAVGVGVPMTGNAPGPTSNAYDIGITPRVRLGYPAHEFIYPYLVAALGPAWSRVPQKVWLNGFDFSTGIGASVKAVGALSLIVELGYRYTSFSGDMPLYHALVGTPAPILHGAVRVSYLSAGAGFEVRL